MDSLFKFYQNYQDNDYQYDALINIQKRFIELYKTYNADKCPHFNKEVIKLIVLSDKKKVNLKKFLVEFLQQNMDIKKVNEIYVHIIDEIKNYQKN